MVLVADIHDQRVEREILIKPHRIENIKSLQVLIGFWLDICWPNLTQRI